MPDALTSDGFADPEGYQWPYISLNLVPGVDGLGGPRLGCVSVPCVVPRGSVSTGGGSVPPRTVPGLRVNPNPGTLIKGCMAPMVFGGVP